MISTSARRGSTGAISSKAMRPGRVNAVVILAASVLLVAVSAARTPSPLFGQILVLIALVASAAALGGVWLILRGSSMLADAIAHSILFGVVAVLLVRTRVLGLGIGDLASPSFLVGAALAGVLTAALVHALEKTGLVRYDAAIGMVFSFLFAAALLAIGAFFRDAHVDEHVVLAGGAELTVLNQVVLRGVDLPAWTDGPIQSVLTFVAPAGAIVQREDGRASIAEWRLGPRASWTMLVLLLGTALLMAFLWKELKVAAFDPAYAAALGFAPGVLTYGLLTAISLTAVGAFEAVGSILVVAFFIVPPATAFLLTDDLFEMVLLSAASACLAAWLGFHASATWNLNFGAGAASAAGALFVVALVAAPRQGLAAGSIRRRRQRLRFEQDLLLVHVANHSVPSPALAVTNENGVDGAGGSAVEPGSPGAPSGGRAQTPLEVLDRLAWAPGTAQRVLARALADGELELDRMRGDLSITSTGAQRIARLVG